MGAERWRRWPQRPAWGIIASRNEKPSLVLNNTPSLFVNGIWINAEIMLLLCESSGHCPSSVTWAKCRWAHPISGRGLIGWARCLLLDDPNGDGWLFRSKKYRGATKGEVLHFHARAHTSTVTRPIAQSIRPSGIYYCCCWLLHSNNNIPEIIKRNKNNNKHSQGNTTNSEVKPTKQPLYISHPS